MEAILNFDLSVFKFIQDFIWADWLTPIVKVITWCGDGYFWVILAAILCVPKKTRKIGVAMLFAQLVMLFANNVILKSIFSRTRPFALFNPEVAKLCDWMPENYVQQVIDEMKEFSAEFQQKWLTTYQYIGTDIYPYAHGYSFPSGHTSSSFAAACGALSMCKGKGQKIFGWLSVVLAALIGFTRIYLHVHYTTDVLVGAVVGLLCGVAGYFICKALMPYIQKLLDKIGGKSKKTPSDPSELSAEPEA